MTEKVMSATGSTRRGGVRHLARHQVMGLAAQFLLGMALSLVGQPSQTTGGARVASDVLLGAHVLLAAGLVAGAAMVIRAAARTGGRRQRRLAHWGAVVIALTFVTGVLAVATGSNLWSYAMGLGFIASLALYAALLVVAGDPPQQAQAQPERPLN